MEGQGLWGGHLNKAIEEKETLNIARQRRIRWLGYILEYKHLQKLTSIATKYRNRRRKFECLVTIEREQYKLWRLCP